MLDKQDLPLLEFDEDPGAVLCPTHENLGLHLPEKAVFAFVNEETITNWVNRYEGKQVGIFETVSKRFPVYEVAYEGEPVCLCQAPLGAPAAVSFLDWLIGYGVRKVISTGSCGVLRDLPENAFLIPTKALRDEGTSYHYAPPARWIELHPAAVQALAETLTQQHIPHELVATWTTDGFFRETREKVMRRLQEGCSVVEMECAALAACAQFRGILWGQLLFTGDSLTALDQHDNRNFGRDSHEPALKLCFDAVIRL